MNQIDHPHYKAISDIIEINKSYLSSGEIAILILEFLKAERIKEWERLKHGKQLGS